MTQPTAEQMKEYEEAFIEMNRTIQALYKDMSIDAGKTVSDKWFACKKAYASLQQRVQELEKELKAGTYKDLHEKLAILSREQAERLQQEPDMKLIEREADACASVHLSRRETPSIRQALKDAYLEGYIFRKNTMAEAILPVYDGARIIVKGKVYVPQDWYINANERIQHADAIANALTWAIAELGKKVKDREASMLLPLAAVALENYLAGAQVGSGQAREDICTCDFRKGDTAADGWKCMACGKTIANKKEETGLVDNNSVNKKPI